MGIPHRGRFCFVTPHMPPSAAANSNPSIPRESAGRNSPPLMRQRRRSSFTLPSPLSVVSAGAWAQKSLPFAPPSARDPSMVQPSSPSSTSPSFLNSRSCTRGSVHKSSSSSSSNSTRSSSSSGVEPGGTAAASAITESTRLIGHPAAIPSTVTNLSSSTASSPSSSSLPTAKSATVSTNRDPGRHDDRPPPVNPDTPEEQRRRDVRRLLALFARLAVPYLKLEKRARVDAVVVGLMTLAQTGVSVLLSFISRDFWSAMNTKDIQLFQHQATLFFAVLIACVPVVTYYAYVRDMAALRWRAWMTDKVLTEYTANRAFYDIDQEGILDNPDQRISADLDSFTSASVAFTLTMLTSTIDLVAFSAILYSIYPQLFLLLITYASTGTIATLWLGKRFVALNRQQLVREADFRYALIRLRENAESVAFFNGERREKTDLSHRLALAVENMTQLIGWQRNLGFLQTAYRYAVQVVPALLVAPRYFAGFIELGVVTQSFSAFNHIFNDLSIVVSRFDSLSALGAQLGRIQELCEAVEAKLPSEARIFSGLSEESSEEIKLLEGSTPTVTSRISLLECLDGTLTLDHVTLFTPSVSNSRMLVEDLSFTLPVGGRLLIAGPSGVGKSSLVRAIAGLWSCGSGIIKRPAADDVFFLPQRPYCTLGSLVDNMLYPKRADDVEGVPDKNELQHYLDNVDLHDLPSRMGGFDATCDWGDTLSLGEQQRLSFARLLIAKPKMVCIDEGSSALDLANEERLYNLLREMNVTVVSIGHRPSLLRYHDSILRLGKNDAPWTLEHISQEVRDLVVAQTL